MDNEATQPESILAAQRKEQLKNRVLKAGEDFGNYRVVESLTEGLLAHYYHMQHIRDLHDVTIGIFHYRTAGDEKFLKRLQVLQDTISGFDHESVPKIRDCTTIDERICIFLDPVKGQTLSQYSQTHGAPGQSGVGSESTMHITAELLGALGYAHSQGIDHRDLDSDLIYVQEDGSIRILGMGVKATLGVELFESIVSASVSPLVSSQAVGRLNSFDIMSPEYKAGIEEDSRVDVYAAGFIAYWLLTGHKASLAEYESPSKFVKDLAPGWNPFFDRALERKRDKRFQSCKTALLGLKEIEDEPLSEESGHIQRQIDRIPVPKKIVERGAHATRAYRLFVIGLVGLTLTAMMASFLKSSYTEEVEMNPQVALLASASEPAALQMTVVPPDAKVDFVGYKESFAVKDGQLALAVEPGQYKIKVTAPDYLPRMFSLDIPIRVKEVEQLSVALVPVPINIEIRTVPGAIVAVVDESGREVNLGIANELGHFLLSKNDFVGNEQVLLKKEGYEPQALEPATLQFGAITKIDAPLESLPAKLSITSQPAGASISINDIELGVTPLELSDLESGWQYLMVARLSGYRPSGQRVEIKPGADMTVDFGQLVPLSGSLRVNFEILGEGAPRPAALHDALQVIVDGKSIPFGDKALDALPVGEHRIQLEHPQYISDEVTLVVEDGGNYSLDFSMSPKPGAVKLDIPGGLKPEVRVNGQLATVTDSIVVIPANKEIEIELRLENYLTMVRQFKISPNEMLLWDVTPVAIPGPTKGQSWTVPYLEVPFSWVPPGSFEMGSPLPEHARLPNEGPQTSVRLTKGFWAGNYEITRIQYQELNGESSSSLREAGHPVQGLTWAEAKAFCQRLTNFEREAGRLPQGYVYRLPTEAEWEYAARAGTTTPFYFGVEADASLGHFRGVYPRDRQDGLRAPPGYGTSTVGRYQPNAYGLYDMHGNVREWTLDFYNGRLPGGTLVDPAPRSEGDRIAVRGGGWEDSAARVRSAAREEISPSTRSDAIGFRVFLAPEF